MTALDRTREYIRQAQEGNQEAKEMLLQENTGLIWSIVKRFYGRDMIRRIYTKLVPLGCSSVSTILIFHMM